MDRSSFSTFAGTALAISWLVWAPLVLPLDVPRPIGWFLYYGGVIGPTAAALLCTRRDPIDRRALIARVVRWRSSARWYAVAIALPLLVRMAAVGVVSRSDASWPAVRPPEALVRIALLMFLLVPFEEIGWRGYALPTLQRRFSPLRASIVLAFVWALWHFPLAWASVGHQSNDRPLKYMAIFFISIIPISCIATWLFNRTGESVAVVSVFHVAVNFADYMLVLPARRGELSLWLTTAIGMAVAAALWLRDRSLGKSQAA